jgi:predicted ABC-type ATPase
LNIERPIVLVLAGPNGAGKSTLAPVLLRENLSVRDYVNADTIAQGLSAFASEEQAFRAGRIMLARLKDFAEEGRSFAFESTLATRSYAPWLRQLVADRYDLKVVFLWLRSPELAVARVKARFSAGGHAVEESVVRRRYARGIKNFQTLYSPIAAQWSVLDNSSTNPPELLARGSMGTVSAVADEEGWERFLEQSNG